MNSFKSIERALEYEVSRQIEMAEKGTPIVQSTLRWDDVEGKTYLMRTKENAQDYRYFPEADLPMINVSEELITGIEKTLPELLSDKKKRYVEELKLSDKQILFILSDNKYIDLFEKTLEKIAEPKLIANYMMTEIASYVNDEVISPKDLNIDEERYSHFIALLKENVLNSKTAKIVIIEMLKTGKTAKEIITEKGLEQISDDNVIKDIVRTVLNNNMQSVEDYKNGKDRALRILGRTMYERN